MWPLLNTCWHPESDFSLLIIHFIANIINWQVCCTIVDSFACCSESVSLGRYLTFHLYDSGLNPIGATIVDWVFSLYLPSLWTRVWIQLGQLLWVGFSVSTFHLCGLEFESNWGNYCGLGFQSLPSISVDSSLNPIGATTVDWVFSLYLPSLWTQVWIQLGQLLWIGFSVSTWLCNWSFPLCLLLGKAVIHLFFSEHLFIYFRLIGRLLLLFVPYSFLLKGVWRVGGWCTCRYWCFTYIFFLWMLQSQRRRSCPQHLGVLLDTCWHWGQGSSSADTTAQSLSTVPLCHLEIMKFSSVNRHLLYTEQVHGCRAWNLGKNSTRLQSL